MKHIEIKISTQVPNSPLMTTTCESLNKTIISLHGMETLGKIQQPVKGIAGLTFSKRCRDNKVIPKLTHSTTIIKNIYGV